LNPTRPAANDVACVSVEVRDSASKFGAALLQFAGRINGQPDANDCGILLAHYRTWEVVATEQSPDATTRNDWHADLRGEGDPEHSK
jgi:hypothetical protein